MRMTLFIALAFLIVSCSIQKRVYTKGYHFEKRHKESGAISPLYASTSKAIVTLDSGCDTIFFNNGSSLICKILEVHPTKVRFRPCPDTSNIAVDLPKINIWFLAFANGTYEDFGRKRIKDPIKLSECATLYFKDGREVPARIRSIDEQTINYTDCHITSGAVMQASTDDIAVVVHTDGKPEFLNYPGIPKRVAKEVNYDRPPVFPAAWLDLVFAGLAILSGLVGAFSSGIAALGLMFLFSLVTIGLGFASLFKIRQSLGKYRGNAVVYLAMVLAVLAAPLMLLVYFSI